MDIYPILASKPHNSHYLNRYIKFIQKCQQNNVSDEVYLEKHHICPKANDMFPEYKSIRKNPWNNVYLTPKQHFIAHLILWKTFNTQSCITSFWFMKNYKKNIINSRLYSKIREDSIKNISKLNKGRKRSVETRIKISKAKTGLKHTEETKLKMSITRTNKRHSEQTKEKMSINQKGSKHHNHKFLYLTPSGIFDSASNLKKLQIKSFWCKLSDRIILKTVYENNYYLYSNYNIDIIGKTYKEIGFARILKSDYLVSS